MTQIRENIREQACAVPFRLNGGRPEFCLVTRNGNSRWDFPRGLVAEGSSGDVPALQQALKLVGLIGELEFSRPLDQFNGSKIDNAELVTAYLVRVEDEDVEGLQTGRGRRRWCFPEEAKLRIRRKPIRRLIDLAVRHIAK